MIIHRCDWCKRIEGEYEHLCNIRITHTEEICNFCREEIEKKFEIIKKEIKKTHKSQNKNHSQQVGTETVSHGKKSNALQNEMEDSSVDEVHLTETLSADTNLMTGCLEELEDNT